MKCPICCEEIVFENDICPQCGEILYRNNKLRIVDRKTKKLLSPSYISVYVTERFWASDKGQGRTVATVGAAGFGLVGLAVGDWVDKTVHQISGVTKKMSTAVCCSWENVVTLTYPMNPMKNGMFNYKVNNGVDVKLADGSEFAIISEKSAEDLYEAMNWAYQHSIVQSSMNQESKPVRMEPALQPKIAYNSVKPDFFKCSYCGVTQMREGNFCSYCGKPAPALEAAPEETEQTVPKNEHVTCPLCGSVQDAGNKFCDLCGQKLTTEQPEEKYCSQCGAKIPDGMLFCKECGTRAT